MESYECAIFYNSKNYDDVKKIYEYLVNDHFSVFLDEEEILPGQNHQQVINNVLLHTPVLLVCIGAEGLGPWQKKEIWSSINARVTQASKILIPIILPNGNFDHPDIPIEIKTINAVIFKNSVDETISLQKISDGIIQSPLSRLKYNFERPFSSHEYDHLLKKTVSAYNSKESAERFYDRWRDDIPGEQIELFMKRFDQKGKILDAGCGPGHHAKVFQKNGHDVIGIDLSDESLKIAKKTTENVEFKRLDMRKTSFQRNEFDAVWACASVVHTAKEFMDMQLREFKRITKPNGLISLTLSVGKKPAIEPDGRFFESFQSNNEFVNYLSNAGIEVIDCFSTITTKTTLGGNRLAKWSTFICESIPNDGVIIRS